MWNIRMRSSAEGRGPMGLDSISVQTNPECLATMIKMAKPVAVKKSKLLFALQIKVMQRFIFHTTKRMSELSIEEEFALNISLLLIGIGTRLAELKNATMLATFFRGNP